MNEFEKFHDLFVASVGSAAALTGLLFVAISLGPEKIFGPKAKPEHRASAERAFSAFVNIFFVSLSALLPAESARTAIIVVASIGFVTMARNAIGTLRRLGGINAWRQAGLISLLIYLFELATVVRLGSPHAGVETIVYVLLGLYSYGLGTSWMLLAANVDSGAGR